jgi:Protein of unknown function (DUF4058)
MENPFPGMNPYLEDRHLWRSVRFPFAVHLSDALNQALPENYWSGFGKRAFRVDASIKEFPPLWTEKRLHPEAAAKLPYDAPVEIEAMDDALGETYVKVYQHSRPAKLIAVLDILSPINKMPGTPGRRIYLKQQRRRLERDIHLIEIDLLRDGAHTVACPLQPRPDDGWDYLVCLHRAGAKNKYSLWPTSLQERLPRIEVPLAGDDQGVVIDLQPVLDRCYESGRYEIRIDYDKECTPPLSPENAKWVDELLRKKELRN